MGNDIAKKIEDNLATFNALSYSDKKFVTGITLGEEDKIELVKRVYFIEDDDKAEIKVMTTLARKEIQNAVNEFNAIQVNLFKAKILNRGEEAIDKQVSIMRDGTDESDQLKAASNISKLGLDIVKEENKKSLNKHLKIIIENPGMVQISVDKETIANSFMNNEKEIIDAEIIEEVEEVIKK